LPTRGLFLFGNVLATRELFVRRQRQPLVFGVGLAELDESAFDVRPCIGRRLAGLVGGFSSFVTQLDLAFDLLADGLHANLALLHFGFGLALPQVADFLDQRGALVQACHFLGLLLGLDDRQSG